MLVSVSSPDTGGFVSLPHIAGGNSFTTNDEERGLTRWQRCRTRTNDGTCAESADTGGAAWFNFCPRGLESAEKYLVVWKNREALHRRSCLTESKNDNLYVAQWLGQRVPDGVSGDAGFEAYRAGPEPGPVGTVRAMPCSRFEIGCRWRRIRRREYTAAAC
jgi:hypothetical protein